MAELHANHERAAGRVRRVRLAPADVGVEGRRLAAADGREANLDLVARLQLGLDADLQPVVGDLNAGHGEIRAEAERPFANADVDPVFQRPAAHDAAAFVSRGCCSRFRM